MKKYFSLLLLALTACSSQDAQEVAIFPRYGNYCGYQNPAANETPTPLGEVDNACKNHDTCYSQRGNLNTICDTTLIAEIKNIKPKNEPEKLARKLIISYFRNSLKKELIEINFDQIK